MSPEGTLYLRSQLDDYRFRGDELESVNFLDYFVNTYEERISGLGSTSANDATEEDGERSDQRRGRPKHTRVAYQAQHPRSTTKHRIVRPDNHRNLPDIVGPWFERNDDPATYSLYCASVLACLKPWRMLEDLKANHETWTAALHASARIKRTRIPKRPATLNRGTITTPLTHLILVNS